MGRCILGSLCAVTAVAVLLLTGPAAAEEKSPAAAEEKSPAAAEEKSLYERLGGVYPIAATVDDLVDRLYVNGTLNANPAVKAVHDRQGQAGFKVMVTNWVVEHTGGPKNYSGLPLDKAHAHLNITNREFDVVMNECATTFYKFNVPKKEMDDLMALLESYRSQVVTAVTAK
ncbi:MAG: group 1 truncated hemoglobin [Gammaproteobacteria bacterium]|nr:group 1 truncated hemoglobin [Gammaproteobacteria bacterium]